MLTNAFLCSLSILFIYSAFQEGNIFEKAGEWFEVALGFFYKPVIGCLFCMAPWWGISYYLIFTYKYDLKECIQFIFAVGGINVVLAAVISFLRDSFFDNDK